MKYKKGEDFVYHSKRFLTYLDENNNRYLAKTVDIKQLDLLKQINQISNECKYILPIESFFTMGEQLVYLTKIIPSKTLQDLIDNEVKLEREIIYHIINQTLLAIKAMHSKDILHRDIKPANILVSDTFDIQVIDFDISRKYKPEQTSDTTLFGTRGYAAPEQFGFMQTTKQSDIYAIGKTIEAFISSCYDTFDFNLEKLVSKSTQLDPEMRFLDIDELLELVSAIDKHNKQVQAGIKAGLSKEQISLYASEELSYEQMGVIKYALVEGVDVEIVKFMTSCNLDSRRLWQIKQGALDGLSLDKIKIFARDFYTPEEMGILRACITLYDDIDIAREYLKKYDSYQSSNKFSELKLKKCRQFIYNQIRLEDLDVVMHPHLSAEQMVTIFAVLSEGE